MKNIYELDEIKYEFDYKRCKQKYEMFCAMSDKDFLKNIGKVGHLATHISWFKGFKDEALADNGIVHLLWHLSAGVEPHEIGTTREKFKEDCRLC